MALRTFLAIDLDESILAGLAQTQDKLARFDANLRVVPRENLHVTLHFLGDVQDDRIAEVCRRMAGAAAMVSPFDIDICGVSPQPAHGALRMVWALVGDPTGDLGALHEALSAELGDMALREEDREFRPHVTLARIRSARDGRGLREQIARHADEDFGIQHVAEVVAYSSQLTPDGPMYAPIARAPVGG